MKPPWTTLCTWILIIRHLKSHPHGALNESTTPVPLPQNNSNNAPHVPNDEHTQIIIIGAVMLLSFCAVLLSLIYFTVKLKYQIVKMDDGADKHIPDIPHMQDHTLMHVRSISPMSTIRSRSSVSMDHVVSPEANPIDNRQPVPPAGPKSPNNHKIFLNGMPIELNTVNDAKDANGANKSDNETEDAQRHRIPIIRHKDPYVIEIEEPAQEELDGYDVDLYTTPIAINSAQRKNTRRSAGCAVEAQSLPKQNRIARKTKFVIKSDGKRDASGKHYEWTRSTLRQVDYENHEQYLGNFVRHQVTDERLKDLASEDWKELIPLIGPRNAFRRLLESKENAKRHKMHRLKIKQVKHNDIDVDIYESDEMDIDGDRQTIGTDADSAERQEREDMEDEEKAGSLSYEE